MDVSKVSAALKTAQTELDGIVDGEFKARRLSSLRVLTLAQKAITLAETHIAKAVERSAPKAAPAADAPAPAAEAQTTGKKK